eukprot:712973-Rhodomonas_salina.2
MVLQPYPTKNGKSYYLPVAFFYIQKFKAQVHTGIQESHHCMVVKGVPQQVSILLRIDCHCGTSVLGTDKHIGQTHRLNH